MPRTRSALLAAIGLAVAVPAQIANFPTYAQMITDMQTAAANNPAICQAVDLTAAYSQPTTVNNNSIWAVKISDNVASDEDEPAFLMVSAHHANEYGTPIVALYAINEFPAATTAPIPQITALVDEYEIWIAPCWNPDGYPFNPQQQQRRRPQPQLPVLVGRAPATPACAVRARAPRSRPRR